MKPKFSTIQQSKAHVTALPLHWLFILFFPLRDLFFNSAARDLLAFQFF